MIIRVLKINNYLMNQTHWLGASLSVEPDVASISLNG